MSLTAGIMGLSVRLGLDTGASGALWLSSELAADLDLPVVAQADADDGSGKNTRLIDVVAVSGLDLGGHLFSDLAAPVMDFHPGDGDPGAKVVGWIGFELFQGLTFTLDYPAGLLQLSRNALPEADGDRVLGYTLEQGLPQVPLRIGGHTWQATLDTGAMAGIMVPSERLPQLSLKTRPQVTGKMATLFNEFDIVQAELDGEVVLGGLRLEDPTLTFVEFLEHVNVGRDVLHRLAVTFDTVHRRVALSPLQRND